MATLPRYTSQVGIENTPLVDASPKFDALAKLFGNVEQVGAQMRSETEDAQLQANKYLTQTNITQNVGRIYNEAQQIPDAHAAINHFQSSIKGYSDGMLSTIPSANRPYAQYMLTVQSQDKLNSLYAKLATQNKSLAQESTNIAIQTAVNNASNMLARDPINGAKMGATIAPMIDAAVNAGTMDGKEAAIAKLNAQKKLTASAGMGNYYRLVQTDPDQAQKYKQDFMDKNDGLYSPTEKMAIENQMDGFEKIQATNAGVTAQTYKNTLSSVTQRAQQTGDGPTAQEQSILQLGNPKEWDNTQQQIASAQLTHGLTQKYSNGSIGDMAQGVSELSAPASTEELNSPNLNLIHAAKQEAARQLNQNIKLYKDDPAQAISNDPYFQQKSNELQTEMITAAPQINGQPNPQYQQQVLNFQRAQDQLAVNTQVAKGISQDKISLIPKGQASALAAQINQLPIAQQINFITGIAQRYGSNSPIALKDLSKAGVGIATNLAVAANVNPDSKGMMPAIISGLSQKQADLEKAANLGKKEKANLLSAISNNLQPYMSSLQNYNGPTATTINNIQSQVYRVALAMHVQGQSIDDAAQNAANALINNHYNYRTDNGATLHIPKIDNQGNPIDASMVIQAGQAMRNRALLGQVQDVEVPPYFDPNLPEQQRKGLYISESVLNGKLINLPDDSGVIYVDRSGVPVKNSQGVPFQFTYTELNNPTSPIRKVMNATPSQLKTVLISLNNVIKDNPLLNLQVGLKNG